MSYSLSTPITFSHTLDDLGETFRKWGVYDWSVSPTRPMSRAMYPSDADRIVTLRYKLLDGKEIVLSMGKQNRAEDNLRVLYLAVEAIRKNELRGIGDVVRDAYLQLAAPTSARDPYEVLGVRPDCDWELIEAAYKTLAKKRHSDHGGSDDDMKELNAAYERVKEERQP